MLKEIIQQYLEDDNEALRHLLEFFLGKVMDKVLKKEDKGRSWDAGSNLQKILDTIHFFTTPYLKNTIFLF